MDAKYHEDPRTFKPLATPFYETDPLRHTVALTAIARFIDYHHPATTPTNPPPTNTNPPSHTPPAGGNPKAASPTATPTHRGAGAANASATNGEPPALHCVPSTTGHDALAAPETSRDPLLGAPHPDSSLPTEVPAPGEPEISTPGNRNAQIPSEAGRVQLDGTPHSSARLPTDTSRASGEREASHPGHRQTQATPATSRDELGGTPHPGTRTPTGTLPANAAPEVSHSLSIPGHHNTPATSEASGDQLPHVGTHLATGTPPPGGEPQTTVGSRDAPAHDPTHTPRTKPTMITLHDHGTLIGIALRTPPWPLIASALPTDPEALDALVTLLLDKDPDLPGVNGPREQAEAFVKAWTARTNTTARETLASRLYQLGTLTPPNTPGRARPATHADTDLLVRWRGAFQTEALGTRQPADDGQAAIRRMLDMGDSVTLWEHDGHSVSWAVASAPVGGMSRVGPVYTPPEHRGRGYGSAVTAAVSRHAREAGARQVVLFTDLANPTSNSVYQKIGYRPVYDSTEFEFVRLPSNP